MNVGLQVGGGPAAATFRKDNLYKVSQNNRCVVLICVSVHSQKYQTRLCVAYTFIKSIKQHYTKFIPIKKDVFKMIIFAHLATFSVVVVVEKNTKFSVNLL